MKQFCHSAFRALFLAAALFVSFTPAMAQTNNTFRYESIKTLDDMGSFIKQGFPLGTSRETMRRIFVTEGRGALKENPTEANVEKYLYDINLCSYYIWRWNISADFDATGKLIQAYVNGNTVFSEGKPKKVISKEAEAGKKASILRMQRPRPEASKGETSLGFILFDRDSDLKTTGDQVLIGGGPTRADPVNMGTLRMYSEVDPWRSIFDNDTADRIVPYDGDCADADSKWHSQKAGQ